MNVLNSNNASKKKEMYKVVRLEVIKTSERKCRGCFEQVVLHTGLPLNTKLTIGKTIREVLLFFIPDLDLTLADSYLCSDCVDTLQLFVKFIERCISIEKYLKNGKNETSIKDEGTLPIPKEEHVDESDESSVEDDQVSIKPQITSENTQLDTRPRITIYTNKSNKETPENVQVDTRPRIRIYSKKFTDTANETSENVVKKCDVSLDKTKVRDSENEEVNSELCAAEKISEEDRELAPESPEEHSFTENDEIEEEENVNDITPVITETLDDILGDSNWIKTIDPSPFFTDVNTTHNRVVTLTQKNENLAEFLKNFSSCSIKMMKSETLTNSNNKRVILLGNVIPYCPICKIVFHTGRSKNLHCSNVHNGEEIPQEKTKFLRVIKPSNPSEKVIVKTIDSEFTACVKCGDRIGENESMEDHIRRNHNDYGKFSCTQCGTEFRKRHIFMKHIRQYEVYKTCKFLKCSICNKTVSRDNFSSHMKSHRTHKCHLCVKSFRYSTLLRQHILSHEQGKVQKQSEKKLLCNICGKLLRSSVLPIHMKGHLDQRDFLCHKCTKAFGTKHILEKHLKEVHELQTYDCEICKKKMRFKDSLMIHMRSVHTDTFPFVCKTCNLGFKTEQRYERHVSQHSCGRGNHRRGGPTRGPSILLDPLLPCKYCHRKYVNVHRLRVHILSSHLKDPFRYKCQYCGMTFKMARNKRLHEERHKDPDQFELTCNVCWNKFDSKEELEVHYAKHSKKYKCDLCEEHFHTKHLLFHHRGEAHFNKELVEKEKERLLREGLKDFIVQKF